jgi:hypothetical protein
VARKLSSERVRIQVLATPEAYRRPGREPGYCFGLQWHTKSST